MVTYDWITLTALPLCQKWLGFVQQPHLRPSDPTTEPAKGVCSIIIHEWDESVKEGVFASGVQGPPL